jgi:hypothetical protein
MIARGTGTTPDASIDTGKAVELIVTDTHGKSFASGTVMVSNIEVTDSTSER